MVKANDDCQPEHTLPPAYCLGRPQGYAPTSFLGDHKGTPLRLFWATTRVRPYVFSGRPQGYAPTSFLLPTERSHNSGFGVETGEVAVKEEGDAVPMFTTSLTGPAKTANFPIETALNILEKAIAGSGND